jgi:hypothetical protein
MFCYNMVYGLIDNGIQPISNQGLNHPVYNYTIRPGEVWYIANIPRLMPVLMHNAECLDKARSRGILAICHKPPRCLIDIIKWLPM